MNDYEKAEIHTMKRVIVINAARDLINLWANTERIRQTEEWKSLERAVREMDSDE